MCFCQFRASWGSIIFGVCEQYATLQMLTITQGAFGRRCNPGARRKYAEAGMEVGDRNEDQVRWMRLGGQEGSLRRPQSVIEHCPSISLYLPSLFLVSNRRPTHAYFICRDYAFGLGQTSALACIGCGLGIMTIFRLFNFPLLDGLPSG